MVQSLGTCGFCTFLYLLCSVLWLLYISSLRTLISILQQPWGYLSRSTAFPGTLSLLPKPLWYFGAVEALLHLKFHCALFMSSLSQELSNRTRSSRHSLHCTHRNYSIKLLVLTTPQKKSVVFQAGPWCSIRNVVSAYRSLCLQQF